ncbi:hypothetical protein DFJ77DRAFT_467364 [Powellomyces hirtus]|nr:hypothetical protein DFJ77DRAFT_467364 [Powellomyces hirtus]
MDVKKAFHGPRAERFHVLPPVTGFIGPGGYEVDEITSLATTVLQKPTSNLGVFVRRSTRFPDVKQQSPPVGKYDHKSFLDLIEARITSRREVLNTRAEKSSLNNELKGFVGRIPGPGTYDVNYAIGRHVANDGEFSLYKSNRVRWRDQTNRDQLAELRKLLGSNDLFTDKRACRRMAHLALYYPA